MKREEKNKQMRRRILDSALHEFSEQDYGASSINAICAAQDISKGIVHHCFESKDALFLACVEECFQRLADNIRANITPDSGSAEEQLERYFALRAAFFQANAVYQRIFCEAVISPPAHLRDSIQEYKRGFDTLSLQILERLLAQVSLRQDISGEDIIETFRQFQDFINIRSQTADTDGCTFKTHEERCRKALSILLCGIVERKDPDHAQRRKADSGCAGGNAPSQSHCHASRAGRPRPAGKSRL